MAKLFTGALWGLIEGFCLCYISVLNTQQSFYYGIQFTFFLLWSGIGIGTFIYQMYKNWGN